MNANKKSLIKKKKKDIKRKEIKKTGDSACKIPTYIYIYIYLFW